MISKNFYDHWLIIHFQKLWRGKNGEICKIGWKSKILKCQYSFTNISVMKASIFMKFETHAPKVVIDCQNNFCRDLCTNTYTRGVNIFIHDITCARTFTFHVLACLHGSSQIFFGSSFLSYELKYQISWRRSFRCRDICKMIPTFQNHWISMYFLPLHSFKNG